MTISVLSACGTLNSTTYIEPQKSFVLGEGMHRSYSAKIKNTGDGDVEVTQADISGTQTSLGILKKGASSEYSVSKNTSVRFKNVSDKKGEINIKLKGNTDLSMRFE